jgi:HEAT repeat protein
LAPLPDDPPSWLDMSAIPPAILSPSTDSLISAARDPDWAARYYAVQALARHIPADSTVVRALAVAADDDIGEVRTLAIEGLGRAGASATGAVDALMARLRDPHAPQVELDATEQSLAFIGPSAYAKVATLLASANDQDVDRAAKVLEDAQQGSTRAQLPALKSALQRAQSWDVEIEYSHVFKAIVVADPTEALRILIPLLQNSDSQISGPAGDAMAEIVADHAGKTDAGMLADTAVAALVAALGSADQTVRLHAVQALGEMGAAARSAIPALQRMRSDNPQSQVDQDFQRDLERTLSSLE